MSSPKPLNADGVLVGGQGTPLWRRLLTSKRFIIGVFAAVAVSVGLLALWEYNNPGRLVLTLDKNAPTDYMQMTPEQIRARLYHDTGLDIEKLKTKELKAGTFKDFKAARDTGRAFRGLRDYKKSQQAYAIAEAKADSTTKYAFYMEYAGVADVNGDKATSKRLSEKTKQAINSDSSLSDIVKAELIHEVDSKQRLKDLSE